MTTDRRWSGSPDFTSGVDGIEWPALPVANGMALASLLFQFAQSEWWPNDRIEAAQRRQLDRLIKHARASVPFYRDRLSGLATGWTAMNAEAWQALPLLHRQDIQSNGDSLHSDDVPEAHGAVGSIHTSGSTGRPIHVLRTQLNELFWSAFTLRDHLWHRRDLSGVLATIRISKAGKAQFPDGSTSERWGPASAALFRTGPCVNLNIMTSLPEQLDWLKRHRPTYLLSHPTNVERLARLSLETGDGLPTLRQVITIAEITTPDARRLVADAWNVPIADIYSAREAGYLALQCPVSGLYHVQAEGVFMEILDDEGQPCAPGTVGRVVVTPMHNFAMPLIRYDIGDLAEVGPPCACGRGLPVLQRIFGRRQNMLVMPNGQRKWPLLSSADIAGLVSLAPVRQYQFVQYAIDSIEFRLSVARTLDTADEAALTAWLHAKFGYPFRVAFRYFDEIPLDPSGKFADFTCKLSDDSG